MYTKYPLLTHTIISSISLDLCKTFFKDELTSLGHRISSVRSSSRKINSYTSYTIIDCLLFISWSFSIVGLVHFGNRVPLKAVLRRAWRWARAWAVSQHCITANEQTPLNPVCYFLFLCFERIFLQHLLLYNIAFTCICDRT